MLPSLRVYISISADVSDVYTTLIRGVREVEPPKPHREDRGRSLSQEEILPGR